MNPLQISLIAVALVVIVAIIFYNWFQERKYRKQSREMFQPRADVLLHDSRTPASAAERIEPHLDAEPSMPRVAEPRFSTGTAPPAMPAKATMAAATPETTPETQHQPDMAALREPHPAAVAEPRPAPAMLPVAGSAVELPASPADDMIDFEVRIHAIDAIPSSAMAASIEHTRHQGKPVHWWGYARDAGQWVEISPWREDAYTEIAIALQLADRNGATSEDQLTRLCVEARQLAARFNGVAECPELAPALQRAAQLDLFCVDVDVLVGLNVVSRGNAVFSGARVAALAQAAGMALGADGVYHSRDARNESLYSLCNHESAPFSSDAAGRFSTHGVTLLFDVPRVADGLAVFDRMTALGHQLSEALGGQLVDDNIRPLTQAGIDRIRAQLAQIYARMEARGIAGGSERALRLFN